jgi:hypothetical protein
MELGTSGRAALKVPSELVGPLPRTVTMNFDGDSRYLLIIVLLFFVGGGIWLAWKGYDGIGLHCAAMAATLSVRSRDSHIPATARRVSTTNLPLME